ncbi:acyltransferase family protein [Streptomyces sp. NPDC020192]|uniref:acyltransferase family protein n=1 Tax=Streptomyces sp. NPDC020192 TaxID=3365066 RepID=UPI0037B9E57C
MEITPPSLSEQRRGRGRLDSLTGLRFLAAILVVLGHSTRELAHLPVVSSFFGLSGVGVTFFFLLSGFVLTWSYRDELPTRTFYLNRFARIYPLHVVTWLIAAVLMILVGPGWRTGAALSSLLLVQAWIPDPAYYFAMNGPSWSLSCEAFFYAVFPPTVRHLARCGRRRLHLLLIGFAAVDVPFTLAMDVLLPSDAKVAVLYTDPLYRLGEFLVGVGLGLAMRDGWRPSVSLRGALWLAGGAYSAVGVVEVALEYRIGVFGRFPVHGLPVDLASLFVEPAFALLIATAAAADLSGARTVLCSRPLVRLGQWSFALYLSHHLLIDALKSVAPERRPWPVSIGLELVILAAMIGLSGVLYVWVERPAEARLRRRAAGRSAGGGAAVAVPRQHRQPTTASTHASRE